MSDPQASIRVSVDLLNPGQFFACCGLLELADRLWRGAEGWFEHDDFCIACKGTLAELITAVVGAELSQLDPNNDTSSEMLLGKPFNLRLDWWQDTRSGGRELKTWAGRMSSVRIAQALKGALRAPAFSEPTLLSISAIVRDADDHKKKVEPFYFDAHRGPNAHSRDVGFSTDALSFTSTAKPASEFFCLVGLQRVTPPRAERARLFDYYSWHEPLPPELVPAAVSGLLPQSDPGGFRFENWYRTAQRKHKAFLPALSIPRGNS